ncbi:MAG: hypothetical protein IJW29_01190 [Clostridia bacterium]|nr:hypothetical protein [Clostridia bacterium]
MNKTIKFLAAFLILITLCAALTACAEKPAKDPETAKDALEDKGYEVMETDDGSYACEALNATLWNLHSEWDFGFSQNALDSATDEITDILGGDSVTLKDLDEFVVGIHWEEKDFAAIFYFDSRAAAKDAYKDQLEKIFEIASDLINDQEYKITYGMSGSMIWFGTESAIKATK